MNIAAALAVWAWLQPAMLATAFTLASVSALLFVSLLGVVQRTNHQLARLIDALHFGDFTPAFGSGPRDAGFDELMNAFERLLQRQRDDTTDVHASVAHLSALIDHVPIPLLAIDTDERVELLNHAARRLFVRVGASGQRLENFYLYGAQFVNEMRDVIRHDKPSGIATLSPNDDAPIRMRMRQTSIIRLGRRQRLIALQPIQSDIDAAEMTLARNLTRVLTHEIMNSLTPVTSIAHSAAALANAMAADIDAGFANDKRTKALSEAVATVARRADGLMQFVQRYREIAQAPVVESTPFLIADLAADLALLLRAEWPQVKFEMSQSPLTLEANADRQLLEQVLINLLRNAAQAACAADRTCGQPRVSLHFAAAYSGRTLIEVRDNGDGIALQLRDEVFLPFFTTKPDGSGVGLSLARQIVLAHGGAISVDLTPNPAWCGACIRAIV